MTYLKIYDDIRKLLSEQQYARMNGFTPSFFSFNMDGGRCPECQGEGFVKIGMQFMADVKMVCEACGGKRFKPEILEVKYKGKNIDDILNMSVEEAIGFFGAQSDQAAKRIAERLQPLVDVGLSYIKLGQSSSTLSGGERRRTEIARALAGDPYFLLLDEPFAGIDPIAVYEIKKIISKLSQDGIGILITDHNVRDTLEITQRACIISDGRIVVEGSKEEILQSEIARKIYLGEQFSM